MWRKILVFWLLAWATSSSAAFAHPHIFVDCGVRVVFDQQGLAGIKLRWVFDEMFGSAIIQDYDQDRDNEFDRSETAVVQQEAFAALEDFSYFTHIEINGRVYPVVEVQDFSAAIVKGRLLYSFFIPCPVPAEATPKHVRFGIFDESYYTDIKIITDLPTHEGTDLDGLAFECQKTKAEDLTYYYGMIVPEVFVLELRKK